MAWLPLEAGKGRGPGEGRRAIIFRGFLRSWCVLTLVLEVFKIALEKSNFYDAVLDSFGPPKVIVFD